ncbi:MAG: NAD(P)-binding domain-containing protein [Dongiaceae bacterium]
MPRICILGAGPSGIAAGRALLEGGFDDVVLLDRNDRVGGNWVFDERPGHSSVYETAHAISSRRLSEYDGFPMPPGTADYPSHRVLQAYFAGYADRFGVTPRIRFGTELRRATALTEGGWRLELDGPAGASSERCDALLVASGHHWDPLEPSYPGTFDGRLIHAHQFKSARPFAGQRVLVIGGGNSACDVAVETARVASFCAVSMRRGYHFFPKLIAGRPTDIVNGGIWWLPRPLRAATARLAIALVHGSNRRYGLPRPRHGALSQHPTLNSEILHAISHGEVAVRPDVVRFEGRQVVFADGRSEPYDCVVAATGYRVSFPFLDREALGLGPAGTIPPLYLNVVPPGRRDLFFIGLIQPVGCIWTLAELQGRLVAAALAGRWTAPADIAARIARQQARSRRDWMATPRHALEVDYHRYRRALRQELAAAAAS